ncbi:ABC transporter [Phytophthora megakarya]|uniref:ABC transporter n=1 Tax=Phytophthora megakarya TaxID=4795 RepID=A0A225VBF0_9STRA|nr:ABC transporter [Phytophthora megakarya]
MSGAEIVDSWEEVLIYAVGHERLVVKALEFSASRFQDEDDDEFTTHFIQVLLPDVSYQPHASVIVQGPIKSLAVELQNETRKMICRLHNTLRSGYVLPGNGGFWCACAAAVKQKAETLTTSNLELLSFATDKLADSLLQLGVILLENSGGCNPNAMNQDSYFSRLARVRQVQQNFERGVQDVGADKFFSRYYDFRSTEYALLSSRTEPECENGRGFHADEYKSMNLAIRGAFRVVHLLLSIDRHRIN